MRLNNTIRGRFVSFLFFFYFVLNLSAQEDLSPQLPDLILPPFLLELEDQLLVQIEAPLPGEEEYGLPPLEMPLPGPEDLSLSPFSTDLQISMGENREIDPAGPVRQSIFTSGKLGAGPGNYILGDLTIHRLEDNPRFSLHFLHESRDGFSGAAAGEGFSQREELLEGSFAHSQGPVEADGRLSYGEREWGLQGLTAHESLILRSYLGEGVARRRFGQGGLWSLSLKGFSLNRWLSGGTEASNQILSYQPELKAGWEWEKLSLFTQWGYQHARLTATGDRESLRHHGNAKAALSARLPQGWQADVEGGISWSFQGDPEFPFLVKLEGPVGSDLALAFQGGRVNRPYEVDQLRKAFPLLSFEDGTGGVVLPAPLTGWEASASFTASPGARLGLEGRLTWARWENMIQPGVPLTTGERALEQAPAELVRFALAGRGDLSRYLAVFGEWEGRVFLDRQLLFPDNLMTLTLEIQDQQLNEKTALPPWGARFSGSWAVYPGNSPLAGQYPVVSGQGFYRITPGGRIMLELSDLLSPFLEEGRLYWDDLTNPGLTLSLSVSISL